MITKNTVLVLGAGASMPFGFPSGREIVGAICQALTPDTSQPIRRQYTPTFSVLLHCNFSVSQITNFKDALSRSGHTSVDAFLEYRTEFIDVGKSAIAAVLLPFEKTDLLFEEMRIERKNNWYEYLFSQLSTSFDMFDRNALSIITFNYDRSLEHYLLTALKNSYGKTDKECAEKLNAIPIIHVHGKLGDLEWQHPHPFPVPYDSHLSNMVSEMVSRASKKIKIIQENIADDIEFGQAYQLLSEAARVYFLGFGFNQTNLERLQIESLPTDKCIWGTGLDLALQQKINLGRSKISTLKWNSRRGGPSQIHDVDVYDFFHRHAILD